MVLNTRGTFTSYLTLETASGRSTGTPVLMRAQTKKGERMNLLSYQEIEEMAEKKDETILVIAVDGDEGNTIGTAQNILEIIAEMQTLNGDTVEKIMSFVSVCSEVDYLTEQAEIADELN